MDKYDYKILLGRVVDEALNQGQISDQLLKEVEEIYKKDKSNVDSVFGVSNISGYGADEEALYVFVSDKKTWINEGYCSDHYADDTVSIFQEIGLNECQDAIWSEPYPLLDPRLDKEKLITKLKCLGFIYDEKFENFMIEGTEE